MKQPPFYSCPFLKLSVSYQNGMAFPSKNRPYSIYVRVNRKNKKEHAQAPYRLSNPACNMFFRPKHQTIFSNGNIRRVTTGQLLYPFTEPANSPRTKYLPRKMYTSNVGSAAINAPAICTFHSTIWLPDRFCRATITGC